MNDHEILLFNLANRPASFDAVTCIATSMAYGVKHVRFVYGQWKPKDYTLEQAERRWQTIVKPAPELFGIDYSIGQPRGTEYNHMIYAAIKTYKRMGRIGKIRNRCVENGYVTVTLRKSRNPNRDSKDDEWKKFADRCDREVIIIPDNEYGELPLKERMALYAGARLNMGVMNGPMTLLFHSDAPYVVMRVIGCENSGSTSPEFSRMNGITPEFQFPWANMHQKLSYLDDTADNIMAEYLAMERLWDERMVA